MPRKSVSLLPIILLVGVASAAVILANTAAAWPGVSVTVGTDYGYVGVGGPRYYYPPAPVYAAPPPVYVAPPRVYVAPPPVYVAPAPRRAYYAPPYSGYYRPQHYYYPHYR